MYNYNETNEQHTACLCSDRWGFCTVLTIMENLYNWKNCGDTLEYASHPAPNLIVFPFLTPLSVIKFERIILCKIHAKNFVTFFPFSTSIYRHCLVIPSLPLFKIFLGSVFKAGWRDCPDEWYQPTLAADFCVLREVRDICNKALSDARSRQEIRSFLAASIHIQATSPKLASLISSVLPKDSLAGTKQAPSHHHSLSDFLLVSQASLSGTSGADLDTVAGSAEGMVNCPGGNEQCPVQVSVQVSGLHKCPRCWKHTSTKKDSPCERCNSVMEWEWD